MTAIRDTRPQNSVGRSRVNIIVQGRARHGWQEFQPDNDNGVDGIIIYRKNTVDTGEIVFVQIKCGTGGGYFKETNNRPKHFGVNVGHEYIQTHRPRWNRLFGPAILVYVDYKTEKAWWTDLKDDSSYTNDNKSIILVPKHQRFGEHSFGEFRKLQGHIHVSPETQIVTVDRDDVNILKPTAKIKETAREFYNKWARSTERTHPTLGEVTISREGWRHLCRKGRKMERIMQSLSLLGVAKKMIQNVTKAYQLKVDSSVTDAKGNQIITDYISLRAQVIFPQRHSSVVQVVLRRKRKFNPANSLIASKIWFYSVYEPLAKKRIR